MPVIQNCLIAFFVGNMFVLQTVSKSVISQKREVNSATINSII